jgi:hypothetical protein
MLVELIAEPGVFPSAAPGTDRIQTPRAAQVVFDTLPALGMDRMTEGQVEFVLCASALTAQV